MILVDVFGMTTAAVRMGDVNRKVCDGTLHQVTMLKPDLIRKDWHLLTNVAALED